MNTNGHLEADLALYAMGGLDAAERAAVEHHLEECATCRRELQELRGDMALLSLTAPESAPPPRARERLLAAIAREPRVPRQSPWRWWNLVPAAVSLILLVAMLALWQRNQALDHELAAVMAQAAKEHTESKRAREILAVLTAPDAMRVTLAAAKQRPQPQGKAVYVARSGTLVFLASDFAPVPQGKTYELWLLPETGAPLPAGIFKPDVHGNATVLMPSIPANVTAKGFAITVEPESGSTTPTMPILFVGSTG
jgi:anti-sigma-K factor RskA